MNTYIVECRNTEAAVFTSDDSKNGDWETNLQEKIFLENGDTLICRNSYIDTKAQGSGKIVMAETPVTINFLNYNMNWNGADRLQDGGNWTIAELSRTQMIDYAESLRLASADGEPYVLCSKTIANADFRLFESYYTLGYGGDPFATVGDFMIQLVYFDGNGDQVVSDNIVVPSYVQGIDPKVYWYPPAVVYDATKFPVINGVTMDKSIVAFVSAGGATYYNLRVDGSVFDSTRVYLNTMFPYFDSDTVIDQDIYTPVTASVTFTIPEGNYDPVELCELINTKMTESTGTPSIESATNNPLLLNVEKVLPNTNTSTNRYFLPFTDKTSSDIVYGYFNAKTTQICGASQFVLTYKDNQNKFAFQYLHTPIYSKADGSDSSDAELAGYGASTLWSTNGSVGPGDQQGKVTPDPPLAKKNFNINRNGGIVFTGLSPSSFWADQLGFEVNPYLEKNGRITNELNPNAIVTNFQVKKNRASDNAPYKIQTIPASIPVFTVVPKIGTHFTAGFNGVNQTFPKGANFQEPNTITSAPNNDGVVTDYLVSIAEQTQDITALNKSIISNGSTTFGYFLLEIQSHFGNNFLTPNNNFKHITAIVSKYYSKDSYTSSTSGDSIVYVHQGLPMLLNSFKCRILNPDKTAAKNLGPDNTIIMEIVKAQPQPQQLKINKKN